MVFLLDFDNTLFNNDQLLVEFRELVERTIGEHNSRDFWAISEQLRNTFGYVDYLSAIQLYRFASQTDVALSGMASFLFDYPFARSLYPDVSEVLQYLKTLATTVILTDGDMVFQPYKIKASGLWNLVDGKVQIYIHKEQRLADIQRIYPSDHYLLVDDKIDILTAAHAQLKDKITTVFMHQGHYANESEQEPNSFVPDYTIRAIHELLPLVQKLGQFAYICA